MLQVAYSRGANDNSCTLCLPTPSHRVRDHGVGGAAQRMQLDEGATHTLGKESSGKLHS